MKLTVVLTALIGILVLACSTAAPAPVEPTPNIEATVQARLAEEKTPDIEKPVQAQLAAEGKTIVVTSEEVYKEYKHNPIAATMKYKGNWVEATGEITEIEYFGPYGDPNYDNKPFVGLGSVYPDWKDVLPGMRSVLCTDLLQAEVVQLKIGSIVTVKGKFYSDFGIFGSHWLILHPCSVISD